MTSKWRKQTSNKQCDWSFLGNTSYKHNILYLSPYLTKLRADWRCRSRPSISFGFGQYSWPSRRWGPSIGWCCHSIAVLASLFRACPRPCPQVDLFARSHVAWHVQKMTAFSFLPFLTATFWYLRYESLPRSWCVLSSLFAACASGSTFRMLPGVAVTLLPNDEQYVKGMKNKTAQRYPSARSGL